MASYEFDVHYVLSACTTQSKKCVEVTKSNLDEYYKYRLEYANGWRNSWNKIPFVNLKPLTLEEIKSNILSGFDLGYHSLRYEYEYVFVHCKRLVNMCEEILKSPQYQHGSKITLTEKDFRLMVMDIN